MTIQTQPTRPANRQVNVEEEINRANEMQRQAATLKRVSSMLLAVGIIEMLFGLTAVGISSVVGPVFVALVGAAVLVTGVIEFASAFIRNNPARYIWGGIGMAAGILLIAEPTIGLVAMGVIAGIYLFVNGVVKLFGTMGKPWIITGGVAGIIMGIIILLSLGVVSAPLIGILVGINLIIDGIVTTNMSNELSQTVTMIR